MTTPRTAGPAVAGRPSVASNRGRDDRFRLLVAVAAVAVSVVGAVVWSRAVSGGDDVDVVLDEPGEYVAAGPRHQPAARPRDAPGRRPARRRGRQVAPRARRPADGRQPVVLDVPAVRPRARRLRRRARRGRRPRPLRRRQPARRARRDDPLRRASAASTYELLRDPSGAFGEELDLVAYPVTLFVAADGTIVDAPGAVDDDGLRERIAELVIRERRAVVPAWAWSPPSTRAASCCCRPTSCTSSGIESTRARLRAGDGAPGPARRSRRDRRVHGRVRRRRRRHEVVDRLAAGQRQVRHGDRRAWRSSCSASPCCSASSCASPPPCLTGGGRDTTVRSMFVYGVVYATVSLSCTLALFAPLLFERGSVGRGRRQRRRLRPRDGPAGHRADRRPRRRQPRPAARAADRRCSTCRSSPARSSCCRASTSSTTSGSST